MVWRRTQVGNPKQFVLYRGRGRAVCSVLIVGAFCNMGFGNATLSVSPPSFFCQLLRLFRGGLASLFVAPPLRTVFGRGMFSCLAGWHKGCSGSGHQKSNEALLVPWISAQHDLEPICSQTNPLQHSCCFSLFFLKELFWFKEQQKEISAPSWRGLPKNNHTFQCRKKKREAV